MKQLLAILLVVAACTVILADELPATGDALYPYTATTMDTGSGGLGNNDLSLENSIVPLESNPLSSGEYGFSSQAFGNMGSAQNFGNLSDTPNTSAFAGSGGSGSGGGSGGAGSGGGGSGMPLVPYNQGFPGF